MTAMRERMNSDIRARVVLGGKLVGYSGRWPGIVEEAYLLLRARKPLFLVGGFGGAAGWLSRVVLGETRKVPPAPKAFREKLAGLDQQYARHGRTGLDGTDLAEALAFFQRISPRDFRNGLKPDENAVLMRSTNLAEILALLLQGSSRLARRRR